VRKFPINSHLQRIGQEVHPGPVPNINSHGDAQVEEDIPYEQLGEGAVDLNQNTFDLYALRYDLLLCQFIDVVHFFHFGPCWLQQLLTASWFNLLFNFCISNLNFQPA
jgi:hypothetical protein